MTRKEFDQKFNEKCNQVLQSYNDKEVLKSYLSESDNKTKNISTEELLINLFLLSFKINKELIHSVLTEILEFSDEEDQPHPNN